MQGTQNNWQVKAQGKIYEAEYEELKQWIAEGAILLSNQVKRGNLRGSQSNGAGTSGDCKF